MGGGELLHFDGVEMYIQGIHTTERDGASRELSNWQERCEAGPSSHAVMCMDSTVEKGQMNL
jgi:hypothetical protein